jgi:cutinase
VLVAACTSTTVVDTTLDDGSDDGCDDAIVIAARGSGQPAGVGEHNQVVIDRLSASATWERFTVDPVPYPAVAISDDPAAWFEGRYDAAVDIGVAAAQTAVDRWIEDCDDADIVLLGYSQGAQVIEGAVDRLGTEAQQRISAVVLVASPRHDPDRTDTVSLGGEITTEGGLLGAWDPPQWARDRLVAVCDPNDFVCSGALGFTHSSAYLAPALADEVVAAVATKVQGS